MIIFSQHSLFINPIKQIKISLFGLLALLRLLMKCGYVCSCCHIMIQMGTNSNSSISICLLLCVALTFLQLQAKVLATADFVFGATNTYAYTYGNPIGLSFTMDEIKQQMNNQLFQKYLLNSNIFGDWNNNFEIAVHNPGGYKYNCTLIQSLYPNTTINCTYDISNSSFMKSLGSFIWKTTMDMAFVFGIDNEAADFKDKTYMTQSFVPFFNNLFVASNYQMSLLEVADKADTWNNTGFKINYTYTDPAKDCDALNQYLYIYYSSPGLTPDASSQWYDQIGDINYMCGLFTMRGTVFPNASTLTVENLMSDSYSFEYLRNRLKINGTDYSKQLSYSLVTMNELRLIDDPAATGTAANTFAAGLWAIDIFMEWIILGGFRIDFYSPILTNSKQSVLGTAPTYSPSAIYTGLLFALIANQMSPWIVRPAVTAGASSNIKAYGLQNYDYYGVLILNKDTDPNASGEVLVNIQITTGVNCIYYTGDSLSSTSAGTIGGLSFLANNSAPTGNFSSVFITADSNGMYTIPLNYSQAVLCQTIPQRSYSYFPTGSSSDQGWLKLAALLVLLLWLM